MAVSFSSPRRALCAQCELFHGRKRGSWTFTPRDSGRAATGIAACARRRLDDGPQVSSRTATAAPHGRAGLGRGVYQLPAAPRDAYPAQIIDVKKAIAWVKPISRNMAATRTSSSSRAARPGDISLLAGLTSGHADWQQGFEGVDTAVQGVLAMYPVVDLINRHGIRQQARMDGFISRTIIQQTREASPEVYEDGSPISWIHRDGVAEAAPPFCIVQGTHDSLVWVEEVRRFVAEFAPQTSVPLVYAQNCRGAACFEVFHSPRTSHFLNAASMWLEWIRVQHDEKMATSGGRSETLPADEHGESNHD